MRTVCASVQSRRGGIRSAGSSAPHSEACEHRQGAGDSGDPSPGNRSCRRIRQRVGWRRWNQRRGYPALQSFQIGPQFGGRLVPHVAVLLNRLENDLFELTRQIGPE
jgi:hypothetical protein